MKIVLIFYLIVSINCFGQTKIPENFEKTTIKIDKIKFDMYKGTVPVRLNRSDSSTEYISLPVHIIKSPSQSPAEPIYWMEGGPGGSNLWRMPPKEFLINHDFVMVGYRGIDGICMMKSKKLIKAMRGLDNPLLSAISLDNFGTKLKEYAAELRKNGIDLNNFTTLDVIDDFETVRKQLGHQKINLFNASYGTRVALLYSYRYPNAIKRSLMVGVNPPGHLIWYPEATRKIIQTYDSIYKAQSGIDYISIEENIRQSFESMPKRWSLFKLDADKIKTASFLLLYDKRYAIILFDAYRRAAMKNDYSGLYLLQLYYDYMPHFLNYGDMFCKAVSADYNPEINYRQLLRSDSLEIGTPFSLLLWGSSNNWPINLIDSEYRKPRLCHTETLMIGGDLDISTPPEYATLELLPFMPNSKQVILKHMAHTGDLTGLQAEAFNYMALRYFDEGIVDTSKFEYDPVCFEPEKSFNKMAKLYYPAVFILSILR